MSSNAPFIKTAGNIAKVIIDLIVYEDSSSPVCDGLITASKLFYIIPVQNKLRIDGPERL